jgi:hypothetical protein
MKEFEIMFDDLTPEAKERYLEFIGGEDELQYSLPIAIVYKEEE